MALRNALDKVIEVHSENISKHTNCYISNYIENVFKNEEFIELQLGVPRYIKTVHFEGEKFGLTTDEITFYDAFTKHESVKNFYSNDGLICITKILRKNKTIDWQKKETARAGACAASSNASSKATATHPKRWNTRSKRLLGSVR